MGKSRAAGRVRVGAVTEAAMSRAARTIGPAGVGGAMTKRKDPGDYQWAHRGGDMSGRERTRRYRSLRREREAVAAAAAEAAASERRAADAERQRRCRARKRAAADDSGGQGRLF